MAHTIQSQAKLKAEFFRTIMPKKGNSNDYQVFLSRLHNRYKKCKKAEARIDVVDLVEQFTIGLNTTYLIMAQIELKKLDQATRDNTLTMELFHQASVEVGRTGTRKETSDHLYSVIHNEIYGQKTKETLPTAMTNTQSKRPWCDHCNKPGHRKDKCWKLHGKPEN
ncbi:uncharacterized protein FA14DRAFT_62869 [Meira miltonrushii]|uniref:CCHC-type domain-containing protein n=1 Tax=Meira miltonrushii TaxID=1280837 RepID=A0A316V7L7_9BASI|nr:uncharacterized protein FA14DRAFT_62869 [Meira miltonrushii]PWN33506.1 hypothetical protein FA14DRAFT_62869 [Meira miltonrushii]